jgi:pimeloyl-ACP methyl ester carboxylesterase
VADPVVTDSSAIIDQHRSAGRSFVAGGVRSFVRSAGSGDAVLLVHGLPASSFLYRKVIPELADRGLRPVAVDLPGLGLADTPADFDYRIAGLGMWLERAVDALELERFHLVVHDAGGPVGFELARRVPGRVRSLTILDTVVALPTTPFPGELYSRRARRVGKLMGSPGLWRLMMRRVGVADPRALSDAEIDAYRLLALGEHAGAGYLNIMRRLREREAVGTYHDVVDHTRVAYPVQVLWGGTDPILSLRTRGMEMLAATRLDSMTVVEGRHYLQEEAAPQIAHAVQRLAGRR